MSKRDEIVDSIWDEAIDMFASVGLGHIIGTSTATIIIDHFGDAITPLAEPPQAEGEGDG